MRCKSCNAILEPKEIIYDEERKEHDELCFICKKIVLDSLVEQDHIKFCDSLEVFIDD